MSRLSHTNLPSLPTRSRTGAAALGLALLALLAVLFTSGREAFSPARAEGPGITLDESFNVETGVYLVRCLKEYGLASLHPATIREVWGSPQYNPDHPPLARWALGFAHEVNGGGNLAEVRDAAARPASAIAFALTVLIVGIFSGRWFGLAGALTAAAGLTLMPRMFAHAHLASLETFIGLTYAACLLWTADAWSGPQIASLENDAVPARPLPGWRVTVFAGVLFGFALLTKIQAVFIAPALGLWAVWNFGPRVITRILAFGLIGLAVFFAGWPWLWLSPLEHLREYFARTTERQTLYCFYWGQRWADRDVPWHYPWVIFAVTVPISLQLLGLCGIAGRYGLARSLRLRESGLSDPRLQLVLLAIAAPLVVFSLPGIRVYDGERLFAVVFPLWAVVIGRGGAIVARALRSRRIPWGTLAALACVAIEAAREARYHPCELSYYNLAVGGLRGANRFGFERTYWGDSFTDSFQRQIVDRVPAGSVIDVAPVLHPFYLQHLLGQSPILRQAGIALRAYDDKQPGGSRLVVHFHRKADPWDSLDPPPKTSELLAELRRDDVPLVSLYRIPPPSAAPPPSTTVLPTP